MVLAICVVAFGAILGAICVVGGCFDSAAEREFKPFVNDRRYDKGLFARVSEHLEEIRVAQLAKFDPQNPARIEYYHADNILSSEIFDESHRALIGVAGGEFGVDNAALAGDISGAGGKLASAANGDNVAATGEILALEFRYDPIQMAYSYGLIRVKCDKLNCQSVSDLLYKSTSKRR